MMCEWTINERKTDWSKAIEALTQQRNGRKSTERVDYLANQSAPQRPHESALQTPNEQKKTKDQNQKNEKNEKNEKNDKNEKN